MTRPITLSSRPPLSRDMRADQSLPLSGKTGKLPAMLAGNHRAAAEAPGLCVAWQPGSRPPWAALFEAAGKSSLEQSWAYGEAGAAQHGQIVERHVMVADGEPLEIGRAWCGDRGGQSGSIPGGAG